ncbi:MAG TPA: SOS response-associated peptidase [Chloroflexota bacterium]|nr:SOS response-associated peptidase [Chloroflexota bacterium]
MCGRYTVTNPEQIALRFDVEQPPHVEATYNAAPSEQLPVIVEHDGQRAMHLFRWGLVPHWAKDPQAGFNMMNARAETVAEKPAYRMPLRRQRCLVPASGFFEWKTTVEGKRPYYIHLKDDDLFAFAGLYDTWHDAQGRSLETYTVITTAANSLLAPLHERMPVILPRDVEALWLDPEIQDASLLCPLLCPYPADQMAAYEVSRRVNSVRHNDASLLAAAS